MHLPRPRLLLALSTLLLLGAVVGVYVYANQPEARERRARAMWRTGRDALLANDWTAAEAILERLRSYGHANYAHLLQGEMHWRQGRPNDAVAAFDAITDVGEARVEAALFHAEGCLAQVNRPDLRGEAERLLQFVLERRPEDADAHRCLATVYYDQGSWVLAVQHAFEWGRLAERDGRSYRFVGHIYRELAQPGLAIPCYEEALRRDLSFVTEQEVREELAECLTRQNRYAEGLALFDTCGPRAGREPSLIAYRAECLFGLGRGAEAAALLDKALAGKPESVELLRARGKLHLDTGDARAAARVLEAAAAADRYDDLSRHYLGRAFELLDEPEKAERCRQEVVKLREAMARVTKLAEEAAEKPFDAGPRLRLAAAYEELGRTEQAREWRARAAACPPGP